MQFFFNKPAISNKMQGNLTFLWTNYTKALKMLVNCLWIVTDIFLKVIWSMRFKKKSILKEKKKKFVHLIESEGNCVWLSSVHSLSYSYGSQIQLWRMFSIWINFQHTEDIAGQTGSPVPNSRHGTYLTKYLPPINIQRWDMEKKWNKVENQMRRWGRGERGRG